MSGKLLKALVNNEAREWSIEKTADGWAQVSFASKIVFIRQLMKTADSILIEIKGHGVHKIPYLVEGAVKQVSVFGQNFEVTPYIPSKKAQVAKGDLKAPMTGKVVKLLVKVGDAVKSGQVLVILEAMKMEHVVKAPRDGTVESLLIKVGQVIQGGEELIVLSKKPEGNE